MRYVSRKTVAHSLSDLSINLASGWLGVLLISPGFFGVTFEKFLALLTGNLPPAIIVFVIGLFLAEKAEEL